MFSTWGQKLTAFHHDELIPLHFLPVHYSHLCKFDRTHQPLANVVLVPQMDQIWSNNLILSISWALGSLWPLLDYVEPIWDPKPQFWATTFRPILLLSKYRHVGCLDRFYDAWSLHKPFRPHGPNHQLKGGPPRPWGDSRTPQLVLIIFPRETNFWPSYMFWSFDIFHLC